jgi:peroxiredoxin (alkyl hydroperoxide reductase subunit C)
MADTATNPNVLPANIPAPQNDGAADHLAGTALPDIPLTATSGPAINLSTLKSRTVIYIYPRTGVPGMPNPDNWDQIPGARGCTPQSCSFRDHYGDLQRLGAAQVFGLSVQDTSYQREAAERLHLPFPILSDEKLELTRSLRLPTFVAGGMTLLKRMAWVIDDGRITKVFYPVFPPDKNAEDVVNWLRENPARA